MHIYRYAENVADRVHRRAPGERLFINPEGIGSGEEGLQIRSRKSKPSPFSYRFTIYIHAQHKVRHEAELQRGWLTRGRETRDVTLSLPRYHVGNRASCLDKTLASSFLFLFTPNALPMISGNVPASAAGKDTTTAVRPRADLPPPGGTNESATVASPYEIAVQYANACNAAYRKLNEAKRARRAAAFPGAEPVSDDEEEIPVPDAASFVFIRPPEANPVTSSSHSGVEPGTNPLRDTSNLGGEPSVPRDDDRGATVEPEDWRGLVSTALSNNPAVLANLLAPKTQVVDYWMMGRFFTSEVASRNTHTLGSKGTPNAILQMVYSKAYVPLSMLTAAALDRIRSNDGLKYVKVPNSAVKQTLDPSQFGSEDDLSFEVWDQAYSNWLVLLKAISDEDIVEGWFLHRETMRQDAQFSRWNKAWQKFDKQLRMQFTSEPFIIDTMHPSYLHSLDRARMDQVDERSQQSTLQHDHHPRPPTRHSSLPDNRYHPYNDNRPAGRHAGSSNNHASAASSFLRNIHDHSKALCLRCSTTGHRTSDCSSTTANRPERPIISE